MSYENLSIKGKIYTKLHEISRGGMGEIITYENKEEGKIIAVKYPIIPIGMDHLLENEANLMWMLNQDPEQEDSISYMPEITNYLIDVMSKGKGAGFPQLIEYRKRNPDDPNSLPFIAMTYEEGARNLEYILKNIRREGKLLPFPYIIDIVKKICEITKLPHLLGNLHNDLNMRNSGFKDRVLIFDFGISSKIGEKLDKNILGTLEYSSPEIDRKMELTEKSDIYSIGIILYELSTGINNIRELPKAFSINGMRALRDKNERDKLNSKKRELKIKKHIGNYYLIGSVKKERSKFTDEGVPKGLQDLIEDLTEAKPKNRPTLNETIDELDNISRKNDHKEVDEDELKDFMINYMYMERAESLEELEENGRLSREFIYKGEEGDLDSERIDSKYGSSSNVSTFGSGFSRSIMSANLEKSSSLKN